MHTITLGHTNLVVSRMGMGAGSPSRLGQRTGQTVSECVDIRFCRDEPGVHVVLSGTGNPEHLAANLATFDRPPLPEADVQCLKHIFRNVASTTGQSM